MNDIRLIRYRDGSIHYFKDGKQVEPPTIPTYYYRKRKWWRFRFNALNILLKPFKRIHSKFLFSEREKCKKDFLYWYAICTRLKRKENKEMGINELLHLTIELMEANRNMRGALLDGTFDKKCQEQEEKAREAYEKTRQKLKKKGGKSYDI